MPFVASFRVRQSKGGRDGDYTASRPIPRLLCLIASWLAKKRAKTGHSPERRHEFPPPMRFCRSPPDFRRE